ncbi:fluoride efflux transporter FluC [Roseinatronobacter sp. NSM]|uniref:fluoride efflux transporter FluC n=1 Tax=Roseinatronobacter sp. NSM TaxID=3457785 RepID=UPI00403720E6
MTLLGIVALGGGLGAIARAALSSWLGRRVHVAWATLVVNLTGSAALGLAFGALLAGAGSATLSAVAADAPPVLAVFTLGVLGGYTTVSTLALQTLTLWRAGDRRAACATALGSAVSGPVVAGLGVGLGGWLLAVWGG